MTHYGEASLHSLTGWVRNNPEGTVKVLASGSPADLAALNASLHQGPRAAHVDGVDELPAGDVAELRAALAAGRRGFWVSG